MAEFTFGDGRDANPQELSDFYRRLKHDLAAQPDQIRNMLGNSAAVVTLRADGELVGLARGVCDGLRGYLTECKLDPRFQGPAAVTRTDGRIEHDESGMAAEMARRILERLYADGAQRVDVVAWGTEVDFLEELGFRRVGGLVGMTMKVEDWSALTDAASAATA